MKIVMFYHSLVSDWNHGNAHFLRGTVTELMKRGHEVTVYEPQDGWSLTNLLAEHGPKAVDDITATFPHLRSTPYRFEKLDLNEALADADLVIVHEWSDHELVAAVGEVRRHGRFRLLFHDTHHRSVSDPKSISRYDLSAYDGVLAFGDIIRSEYLKHRWTRRAWTWHEAADASLFQPRPARRPEGDVVWIGNWGDEERTEELRAFLLEPVKRLGLKAAVYGVRYPEHARRWLDECGIEYRGWLPNHRVPEVFGRFRLTVHVPRRYYAQQLRGIPTIRPFEALACGIPLISAPWQDSEGLFTPGRDYLVARDGQAMTAHMQRLLSDPAQTRELARHGRQTILAHHTCAHRVDQLLAICKELGVEGACATAGLPSRALEGSCGGSRESFPGNRVTPRLSRAHSKDTAGQASRGTPSSPNHPAARKTQHHSQQGARAHG